MAGMANIQSLDILPALSNGMRGNGGPIQWESGGCPGTDDLSNTAWTFSAYPKTGLSHLTEL